jgi:hypothetical protein
MVKPLDATTVAWKSHSVNPADNDRQVSVFITMAKPFTLFLLFAAIVYLLIDIYRYKVSTSAASDRFIQLMESGTTFERAEMDLWRSGFRALDPLTTGDATYVMLRSPILIAAIEKGISRPLLRPRHIGRIKFFPSGSLSYGFDEKTKSYYFPPYPVD